MEPERLRIHTLPKLNDGRMVLAFSGWMDGGDVSTGTVEWLIQALQARPVATLDPEGFYIYNFPGSMEIAALFRPHTKIEDGIITALKPPGGVFFCNEAHRLILFRGKEPNLSWAAFADCIFEFASRAGVSALYFIGSVSGAAPHSRDPRLMSTVSEEHLKVTLAQAGVRFTNYEGPASFSTYLLAQAKSHGVRMVSLVAQIPAYVQGTNPKSIEAMVRKLAAVLGLQVSLDDLRSISDEWEKRLSEALREHPELLQFIRKLEEDHDNEVFDTQMGELKDWLEQRGIRVD